MSLNFEEIIRNATEQGVALSEIAIFYEGLDDFEVSILQRLNLVVLKNETSVVAKFSSQDDALFPDKAVGVYSLAS